MAQEYEQLKLENQLCFPLYACARKIVNAYTPHLKPLGLTYTQYIVFMVLWDKEKVTVGELGKTLSLDAGTLTPLLKKLEKDGYITRERSKEDERVTEIVITKKGNDLKKKCKDIPGKVASVLSPLKKNEIESLYKILYKIID
ncbi:MAG: MarR family transcriptional regulator [Lachnospiraceae bacterium]|nr:MarR family transcriptional regulator [Lachnospiraceae bacterium]MBQ9579687.1 MarR family transcriptional regulator [Lachnospiraceae bacterium]